MESGDDCAWSSQAEVIKNKMCEAKAGLMKIY